MKNGIQKLLKIIKLLDSEINLLNLYLEFIKFLPLKFEDILDENNYGISIKDYIMKLNNALNTDIYNHIQVDVSKRLELPGNTDSDTIRNVIEQKLLQIKELKIQIHELKIQKPFLKLNVYSKQFQKGEFLVGKVSKFIRCLDLELKEKEKRLVHWNNSILVFQILEQVDNASESIEKKINDLLYHKPIELSNPDDSKYKNYIAYLEKLLKKYQSVIELGCKYPLPTRWYIVYNGEKINVNSFNDIAVPYYYQKGLTLIKHLGYGVSRPFIDEHKLMEWHGINREYDDFDTIEIYVDENLQLYKGRLKTISKNLPEIMIDNSVEQQATALYELKLTPISYHDFFATLNLSEVYGYCTYNPLHRVREIKENLEKMDIEMWLRNFAYDEPPEETGNTLLYI